MPELICGSCKHVHPDGTGQILRPQQEMFTEVPSIGVYCDGWEGDITDYMFPVFVELICERYERRRD